MPPDVRPAAEDRNKQLLPQKTGGFALFVNTRQQATLLAYDANTPMGAYTVQFAVGQGGEGQFVNEWIVGAGMILSPNQGRVDALIGDPAQYWMDGLFGYATRETGAFAGADGRYTGTWTGTGGTSRFVAILSSDGQLYYCSLSSSGQATDGGMGQLDANGSFNSLSVGGAEISGALNSAALSISGGFTNQSGTGTFSLGLAESNHPDTPPVIKTSPHDLVCSTGSSTTLKVMAAGSPPRRCRWPTACSRHPT